MKFIVALLFGLSFAHAALSQTDTVWIAPSFYLRVDTTQWEMLYEAPEPLMVYHMPVPQQITHRKTGFVILFQAAYAVEEKALGWISNLQKQMEIDNGSSKFLSMKDPKQHLRNSLFHKLEPMPNFDTAHFEAYRTGSVEQTMSNAYLWINSPYYLLVSTPKHVDSENQMVLLDILSDIQITSPQHMDEAMQRFREQSTNSSSWTSHRAAWIRRQITKSYFERSKSKIYQASDDELISPIDSVFTFTDLDKNLRQLCTDPLDLDMILKKVGSNARQYTNHYHAYHLSTYRLQLCYEMLALYGVWKQFPKDIQKFDKMHLMRSDSLLCFEAASAASYHLLSIYTDKETVRMHLDSFPLHLLEYRENKIQPKKITARTSLASLVDNTILPGQEAVCLITTAHHLQQGEKIAAIYDDFYFYAPQRSPHRLVSFTSPKNLKAYDALIRYTLDENDIYLIEKHFAARDTVRFYHDCDLRDDSPDMLYYKGLKEQELKTPPAKRLYGTNLITTDMNNNGSAEYWQLYITNGKVVQTHFFAADAVDDSLNTSKYRKALMQLPQLKKLLAVSQSTGINNHQLLCRSDDSDLVREELYHMAVAETTFDEDLIKRIQADTSVYQYPHRAAYFRKNDYAGERYLVDYISTKRYPSLPDIARYKVSFIVEKDGRLSKIHIHSLGSKPMYAIETHLMELVMRMPNWEPATVEDVPVRSYGALYYGIYVK